VKADPNVRKVLLQIVEASTNSYSRFVVERMRNMLVEERSVHLVPGVDTSEVFYAAGRNDVLKELIRWLEARADAAQLEQAARDVAVIVEDNVRRDVP
jgi:hypothetical protein